MANNDDGKAMRLTEMVMENGKSHGIHPHWLDIDTARCCVSWTDPDDDDEETTVLHALFINTEGSLVCLWGGNRGSRYSDLDEDLQKYLHDCVVQWLSTKVKEG